MGRYKLFLNLPNFLVELLNNISSDCRFSDESLEDESVKYFFDTTRN